MALYLKISAIRNARVIRKAALLSAAVLISACSQLERPKVEPFLAVTVPPPKQELRWSNGKMPKSLDPARASAAPETDIIRAIYDGLTDLDSKSLNVTAAVAEKWESSDGDRVWTFTLRKEARWSNGERVTAADFVRSWKRLATMRDKAANRFLTQNILGMQDKSETPDELVDQPGDLLHSRPPENGPAAAPANTDSLLADQPPQAAAKDNEIKSETGKHGLPTAGKIGVEAIGETTLKVSLELPDKDFPRLVANPIFRPVYGNAAILEKVRLDQATVTNGAFRVVKIAGDSITLEPSENHWNRRSVALESVRFVASTSAENALDAYKKGEVDVVTNAAFEPLALKLLRPYEDFRRSAHGALNFYEFNTAKTPFSDRRVREALAIAIDRARLTEGELEGIMQPANAFSPLGERRNESLSFDVEKAKELIDKAGYKNGQYFPVIRLVINRNDTQQRVARSVAKMWQQNLNLETQIIVKEQSEIAAVRQSGDFDLIRRGVVLPANDEIVNLASIFGSARKAVDEAPADTRSTEVTDPFLKVPPRGPDTGDERKSVDENAVENTSESPVTMTEADALYDLRAIPLYFPTSFALVKPYVRGFEMNGLDAPSLKEMSIDSSWQPKPARGEP